MAKIPAPVHTVSALIDRRHESVREKPRPHFGASQLGQKDTRGQWLNFRWAFEQAFEGRVLRLFRRGHNEEATVVADLKAVGMDIVHALDCQLHIDFGSHVSGSCDGVILSGVPEAPSKPHLLEIKTMGRKAFEKITADGLEVANPVYWVQVHTYMHGITKNNLIGRPVDRCLFLAVCKDDDRIYTERVKLDAGLASSMVERGQQTALSNRMPEPVFFDPSFWEAKFSPFYALYFPASATGAYWGKLKDQREGSGAAAKVCVNCRTCAHSTPTESGHWVCELHSSRIPAEWQYKGCEAHVLHPDIAELCGIKFLGGDGVCGEFDAGGNQYRVGRGGITTEQMLIEVARL